MEYNTTRPHLSISEYGRHIQKLVDYCLEIEDKVKRTECAQGVIGIMGNLNPHLRDVPDFQHKLWDQLHIMSDFKLDVDSPFDKPEPEKFHYEKKRVGYPKPEFKYRYYGQHIKEMIREVSNWEDSEKKENTVISIANNMKKNYLTWNKEQVEDNIIFEHLYEISGGKINLMNSDSELMESRFLKSGNKNIRKKNSNSKKNKKNR